jgi:copper chaperone CopZ
MKILNLVLILVLTSSLLTACKSNSPSTNTSSTASVENASVHDAKIQNAESKASIPNTEARIIKAKVNGLVCDFCSRSLEKVFEKQEEVETIKVDLDLGQVAIYIKPGKDLDDNKIKRLVKDSGYDVTNIMR